MLEELLLNTKAYARIQLDLHLEWGSEDEDGWVPTRIGDKADIAEAMETEDPDLDLLWSKSRVREAGSFNGRPMIEVEHQRYTCTISVYAEACDAVLASLLHA